MSINNLLVLDNTFKEHYYINLSHFLTPEEKDNIINHVGLTNLTQAIKNADKSSRFFGGLPIYFPESNFVINSI